MGKRQQSKRHQWPVAQKRKKRKKIKCPCGKNAYLTQEDAIGGAWGRVKHGGIPLRVYECLPRNPGMWHMTKRESRLQFEKRRKKI